MKLTGRAPYHFVSVAERSQETILNRLHGGIFKNIGTVGACRALFAGVLLCVALSSLSRQYLGQTSAKLWAKDFFVYYLAAQVERDDRHADLYQGATAGNAQGRFPPPDSELSKHARAAGFESTELYIYPPLLADMMTPLARFSPRIASDIWCILNLALVFASTYLIARLLRIPVVHSQFALLTMAAFCFFPIQEAISVGQVTIVMLALWTIGIVAYFENLTLISAAAFALATLFKLTPVCVLPLFIIWKDRRWIASYLSILTGLALSMIALNGLSVVKECAIVIAGMSSGIPHWANKSISSVATWCFYGKVLEGNQSITVAADASPILLLITKLLSGVFFLSCLALVWRKRNDADGRNLRTATLAIFAMVSACVSPVSWRHGYSVVFIALAILWTAALRRGARALHVILLSLSTVTLGTIFADACVQGPLPQACKVLLASLWVVFSVLLCLDALYHGDVGPSGFCLSESD